MLLLSVVSPVKKISEFKCKKVTVPTKTGLITILPSHMSLFSILDSGEVIAQGEEDKEQIIIVSGGFVSVVNDKVTLLVDFGVHSDEMDEKLIMEAKARAEKMIEEAKSENISKAALADLLHANLQLRFLPKHKKNRG